MGSYLDKPITDKFFDSELNSDMAITSCSMQGWRSSQEDEHISHLNIQNGLNSLFAVFDGHGGQKVSIFCKNHFIDVLTKL
jgi:serine/threonine protein phosphatase PrpC